MKKIIPSITIIPNMNCQASCKYCFGPNIGSVISESTTNNIVEFLFQLTKSYPTQKVDITLHGGEPLLTSPDIIESLLYELTRKIDNHNLSFKLQSNLWELDENYIRILKKYNFSISTSLDGPQHICDINRGDGYWEKTMRGIRFAESHGAHVAVIASISNFTDQHVIEIAKFFLENQLNFKIHPVLPIIKNTNIEYVLEPQKYTQAIMKLYPWYIKHKDKVIVSNLDNYCKAFIKGDPGECTYKNCLGSFIAIDPQGDIYPCQRFCGHSDFSLGNIDTMPTYEAIFDHPNSQKIKNRELAVSSQCSECQFVSVCHGGCYYNAISNTEGIIDPLCEAIKEIYTFVQGKLINEMVKDSNIKSIMKITEKNREHPLLQKGEYISLGKDRILSRL